MILCKTYIVVFKTSQRLPYVDFKFNSQWYCLDTDDVEPIFSCEPTTADLGNHQRMTRCY